MNKEYTTDFDIIGYIQKQVRLILKEEIEQYQKQLQHVTTDMEVLHEQITNIKYKINHLSKAIANKCKKKSKIYSNVDNNKDYSSTESIESDSSLAQSEC